MTQSPYGGTASQPTQSTAQPSGTQSNAGQTGATNGAANGAKAGSAGSNGASSSGGDFGATTISGSPRQPGAGGQQNSSVATEQRTSEQRTTEQRPAHGPVTPGGQPSGQPGNLGRTQTSAPPSGRGARNRGPRRARLQLRHISPLTVLKFSCVLAIALFFVWLIVVGVLYGVLDAAGVLQKVNDTVVQLNGSGSKPPITAGIVFGGAAIIGVINIVLFVALTTIGSVIYNLCADLVGGIEITLSER
jgi:hypothetical protein